MVVERFSTLQLDEETEFELKGRRSNYYNSDDERVEVLEQVIDVGIGDVASVELAAKNTLEKIDDLLLIASFAARVLTVCLAWECYGGDKIVKQFLRDRAMPRPDEQRHVGIDPIVSFDNFREFLPVAYRSFHNSPKRDVLRQVIYALVLLGRTTIEAGYIQLYTALEMLVLASRREENKEFIFQEERFEVIRKHLSEYIKAIKLQGLDSLCEKENEIAKRLKRLTKNLKCLNRVSAREAFTYYCNIKYKVTVSDLWPVHGEKDDRSLNEIRNRLVHGELMDKSHFQSLIFARQHLRWERMVLEELGWPVERTEISSDRLVDSEYWSDWEEHRAKLME